MHNLTAVFHSYPQISPQVFDISSCKRKKLPTGSRLSSHSLLSMASKHGCFFAWAISRNFHKTKKGMCLQKTHALKPDEQSVVGSVELILGILARDAIHRESMILLEGSPSSRFRRKKTNRKPASQRTNRESAAYRDRPCRLR